MSDTTTAGFSDLQQLNHLFTKIKVEFDERDQDGLVCKQGCYSDCCVLKLQKASWTNDPMDRVQNESGIFFSIWSNKALLRNNRILYNIHALKLRRLEGYAITSRDFAADFREHFLGMHSQWPNVRVDFGPATLMQGWIESKSDAPGEDILILMKRFERLSSLIDRLLQSRRR